MRSCVASIVALILLSAGSGRAGVGQSQDFQVGGRHLVEWAGGIGSANGRNESSVTQEQTFRETYGRASGTQSGRAALLQTGTATGDGPARIENSAAVTGSQRQLVNFTPAFESTARQSLNADLSMIVVKPYGIGSAGATQDFNASQSQTMTTPFGWASQSQSLRALQSANIGTAIDIDPTVTSTLNVRLNQQTTINGQASSMTSITAPWQ
jgi:hypothetical protein